MAIGTAPGLVRIWPLNEPQPRFILRGHQVNVRDVIWSPDGRTLYSAGGNTVRARDAASGQPLRVIDGFGASANLVAWSPDGRQIITQTGNQVASTDVSTGMPVSAGFMGKDTLSYGRRTEWRRATDLTASPTGTQIAVADTTGISLFDATTLQETLRLPTGYQVVTAIFSPDGRYLASAGNSPFVVVWDTTTGNPVHALLGSERNYWNLALAFSDGGRTLFALEATGKLRTWDIQAEISTVVDTPIPAFMRGYYYDPAIHPNTGRVATERPDGIDVARLSDGQKVFSLPAARPLAITINASGTRVAAIVGNGVKVWSLDSGALLAEYTGHASRITDIAFNPDGSSIASSSWDGTVKIWPVP